MFNDFVEVNHQNYKEYQHGLADIPGITLSSYNEKEKLNYQYIVLEVDEAETLVSRDQLNAILWIENVLARRYFYPGCHRMEPYRTYYPDAGTSLPETERLSERILSLPNGTIIGPNDISRICQVIRFVTANGGEIARRLQELNIPKVFSPRSMLSNLPEIDPSH